MHTSTDRRAELIAPTVEATFGGILVDLLTMIAEPALYAARQERRDVNGKNQHGKPQLSVDSLRSPRRSF